MKCVFCGATNNTVAKRENNLELCDVCEAARVERENEVKEEQKVINIREDMPVTEEVIDKPETDIKAELVLGVKKDGSLYFTANGEGVDLLTIEGLLNFGKRRLKQIWDQRDYELQRAAYEAQQKAAAEETDKQ